MFRKVHLKLTILCTTITTIIMLIMSAVYLYVSANSLYQNQLQSYQNDVYTIYTNIEQNSVISMEWISKIEARGQHKLILLDNNVPFLYNQLHNSETDSKLTDEALALTEETANSISFSSMNQTNTILFSQSNDKQFMLSKIIINKNSSSLTMLVFSSLSPVNEQILKQQIFFGIVVLFTVLIIFLLSLFLTARLLKPLKENQQKQISFVASASHELRTPLAVITSSAECCMENACKEQLPFLDTIQKEGKRMTNLISEMLILSQSSEQTRFLHLSKIELDTLCIRIYEIFQPLAKKEQLTISLSLPENSLIPCRCDEEKVMQVLHILISNALSYTPAKGNITISLQQKGKYQTISVSDTGIGISKEDKKYIFDRFYRAQKSRNEKNHFGLGLSIAQSIMKAHHGHIEVKDNLPTGTVFTIYLPDHR